MQFKWELIKILLAGHRVRNQACQGQYYANSLELSVSVCWWDCVQKFSLILFASFCCWFLQAQIQVLTGALQSLKEELWERNKWAESGRGKEEGRRKAGGTEKIFMSRLSKYFTFSYPAYQVRFSMFNVIYTVSLAEEQGEMNYVWGTILSITITYPDMYVFTTRCRLAPTY